MTTTQNGANEPQNSPSVPTSSESGTTGQEKSLAQLRAENDQMMEGIIKRLDECNKTIREINSSLNELRVLSCAVTGFSRALDNFYGKEVSHG